MDGTTRFCSSCGTPMQVRLGQYECPSCGRTEPLAPPAAGSSQRQPPNAGGSSGASSSWDPGAQYRTPPPPPSDMPPPPGGGGYGYGAGGYGGPGYGAVPSGGDDPLRTEKYIYMGLQSLAYVVIIIGLSWMGSVLNGPGAAGVSPTLPAGYDKSMIGGIVAGGIIGSLIAIGLLGFVLFSREIWLKWSCFGCQGCGALVSAGALFAGSRFGSHPGVTFLQLCITAWFLSILYRDIQNIQSGN